MRTTTPRSSHAIWTPPADRPDPIDLLEAQLDDYVELYLEGNANLKVDFEIGDALDKVERLGVVEKQGEFYKAVSLPAALERLDYRWDNYFQYNKA